ncbi:hypothetical protein EVAR_62820_1 [Eumeta japonica]|uniref:Uncharacterized protein n=1 Tax=Eumeta variegata TaxID=151549 RepID=A0A4C2ACL0_EUMVA|nr:hypothetical protein EVAR_62820_1 [Eumeta japonica]
MYEVRACKLRERPASATQKFSEYPGRFPRAASRSKQPVCKQPDLCRNSTSSGAGHFGTLHASPPKRREKDKRRARKSEVGTAASSQWYTSNQETGSSLGLRELRQELSASRPLRAEAERERRASQPPLDRPPSERNSVGT